MSKIINTKFAKNIPWEERPEGQYLPLWRYSGNPLIKRNVNARIDRAYNSAFVPVGDGYMGVFRGEQYNGVPLLFVGRSKDGLHFEIDEEPIHFVDENGNPTETPWQYDPRVVELEGAYYVIWADNYAEVTVGLARTYDFKTFTKLSYPFPPNCRNGAMFPRKINGHYYMYMRPSDNQSSFFGNIFVSQSPDLKYWGEHKLVLKQSWAWWNGVKIGAGPTPIEIDEGWLVIIHGVFYNVNSYVYSMGAMIVEKDDPSKIKYLCENFIMTPTEIYETTGFTPNVVFPTCVQCQEDGKMAIYYGSADETTCLAFTTVDILVDYIKSHAHKF